MFLITLGQIAKMTLILILGFCISKTGLISHEGNKGLSNLLLMVVNPLMVFESFLTECTPQKLRDFLIATALAVTAHVVAILVASVVVKKKGNPSFDVERIAIVFSNCGFMGIPLIHALLGSEGVLYLTPYVMVFSLFLWSYGVSQMTGSHDLRQIGKGMMTPVTFAIIAGFIFFVTGLRLPALVTDAMDYVADMNTPLAMLIAGISLAESNLGVALSRARIYLICAVKLLLIPFLLMLLFRFLPVRRDILCVNLIAAACPTATSGTLFALRYNGDYHYASELFAICTVLSMATIPLFVFVMDRFIP